MAGVGAEAEAMDVKEPGQTRFDLRFSLGGLPFRVQPLFWAASAVLGIRYFADPNDGGAGYFLFWMATVLFSGVLHGLAQGLTSRCFGVRGNAVLFGLGSSILGISDLPRLWQRLTVLLAGPLAQIAVVGGVLWLTTSPFPEWLRGSAAEIANGLAILLWVNYYWALLNVLPLWPLDGGRAVVDMGRTSFGRKGGLAGLIVSLLTCGLLGLWIVIQMFVRSESPNTPNYFLDQQRLSVWLLFVFVLWLRAFQGLWPEPTSHPPAPTGATMRR